MRASELLCRQAGLAPEGSPSKKQTTCVFCGDAIAVGDRCSRFRPGQTFMNGPDLCARDSARDVLCGYCIHLTNKALMQKTQHAFITRDHILPFHKLTYKSGSCFIPPNRLLSCSRATRSWRTWSGARLLLYPKICGTSDSANAN